ncbi:MAG: PepSY-associated TM helix domain-containing protein [Acidobacteriota bacterium]
MKRHGPFRLSRRAVRLFYDIHSWLGILAGLALFVCCFSGTLALFEIELVDWERPSARSQGAGTANVDLDDTLSRVFEHLGDERDFFILLPTARSTSIEARAFGDGHVDRIYIDPADGTITEAEGETAFAFLTHLHTDLHLPRPFGRYLVGFLGIFLMLSLISGAMAHPKLIKELFLLRWRPSLRLTFSDIHKQLGVWSLIFGLFMAFTGAVIGLLGLFAPVMVLSAFGGDVEQATEAFSGPHFEATGVEAPMLPVAPLIAELEAAKPGFTTRSFLISHWGDETAELSVNLERTPYRHLAAGESHRLSLVDGRTIHVGSFTERGLGTRLFGSVQPLHYGLFGGIALKVIYLIAGLALSLGIFSGTMLWHARRRTAAVPGSWRERLYIRLGRAHLGVGLGLVVASCFAIAASRLDLAAVAPVFWTTWVVVLLVALVVPDGLALARLGGFAVAVSLGAAASVDLFTSPVTTPSTVAVDLVFLALGLLAAAASSLTPRTIFRFRAARRPSADAAGVA